MDWRWTLVCSWRWRSATQCDCSLLLLLYSMCAVLGAGLLWMVGLVLPASSCFENSSKCSDKTSARSYLACWLVLPRPRQVLCSRNTSYCSNLGGLCLLKSTNRRNNRQWLLNKLHTSVVLTMAFGNSFIAFGFRHSVFFWSRSKTNVHWALTHTTHLGNRMVDECEWGGQILYWMTVFLKLTWWSRKSGSSIRR